MRVRLDEVRQKMDAEEQARDVFRWNGQIPVSEVLYSIHLAEPPHSIHPNTRRHRNILLALLPTLSEQVLRAMDVDAVKRELQARSRVGKGNREQQVLGIGNGNTPAQAPANKRSVYPLAPYPSTPPPPQPRQTPPQQAQAQPQPHQTLHAPAHHHPHQRPHRSHSRRPHPCSCRAPRRCIPRRCTRSPVSLHSPYLSLSGTESESISISHDTQEISSSFVSDNGSVSRSWVVEGSGEGSEQGGAGERAPSPALSSVSGVSRFAFEFDG
ncbi:hypothetical protein JR316_0003486 [Psilocybe cubensis]|nr:hypothetical protein JR316_0011929 [Psilocybe cubensis]XP_047750935.1 hypothetical protein JR316_0005416 [Psilocybe cubensis]XP_047751632.1 hypothetical protein JR316_0003486 [Psilocybe cubensis]KAH9476354.1 hypothetical protein JR316_0011929 [Psilocybe cubensis]KAH9483310.1 hypothetical protein JR316_0005416 [Psilocybe cubensis]KAH9484007.1 hypothetical protein JR316_0003486 [Psilocybe cubensis]